MRWPARSAWKLKRSNNSSIESMRKGDKKVHHLLTVYNQLIIWLVYIWTSRTKAHRALVLGISKAGPSNIANITSKSKSDASDSHTDDHDTLPEPEEQLEYDGNAGITSPGKRIDFINSVSDLKVDLFVLQYYLMQAWPVSTLCLWHLHNSLVNSKLNTILGLVVQLSSSPLMNSVPPQRCSMHLLLMMNCGVPLDHVGTSNFLRSQSKLHSTSPKSTHSSVSSRASLKVMLR